MDQNLRRYRYLLEKVDALGLPIEIKTTQLDGVTRKRREVWVDNVRCYFSTTSSSTKGPLSSKSYWQFAFEPKEVDKCHIFIAQATQFYGGAGVMYSVPDFFVALVSELPESYRSNRRDRVTFHVPIDNYSVNSRKSKVLFNWWNHRQDWDQLFKLFYANRA